MTTKKVMREREKGSPPKKNLKEGKWKSGFLGEKSAVAAGLLAIPKLTNLYSFIRKLGILG
jgi:hypothetical protein